MVKVGLIGDSIDKDIFREYPLRLRKLVLIAEDGSVESVFEEDHLTEWIQKTDPVDGQTYPDTNAATISLLLQAISSYDDVSLSIAKVPVFPPEMGMLALSSALEWMADMAHPDFLHIGFSSAEGKYQKQQNVWVEKLHNQGCKVICPAGVPPAFPASLNHVISVADRGFIEAGFELSNPDIIIEEQEVATYSYGTWVKQPVSNEIASALVLSNRVREKLALLASNTDNLVQLPDLSEVDFPVFQQQGQETEPSLSIKPSLFHRARSFIKSLLSRVLTPKGRVPSFVKETRKVSCNGDGGAIKACEFRMKSKTIAGAFVCGACGCGDRESVFVDGPVPRFEKLDYPYISCPASMPGFSNYLASSDEAIPSDRKRAIEQKFGNEALTKVQEVQKKMTERLDKRSNWLDGLS